MNTTINTHSPYVALESEPRWYADSLLEFLIPERATHGTISVFRATMPEGSGPPRHVHSREDEAFVVLEGDVLFEIDGERIAAGPGASLYAPRGVAHAFRVQSPVAVTLGIITPGAFEQHFRELSAPAGRRALPGPDAVPFDIPAVIALQAQLGSETVGPPLTADEA